MISEADKQNLYVGFKQTRNVIRNNRANRVYLASDCDSSMYESLKQLCEEYNTELYFISTMKELGEMCSISVGASCAVVSK